MVGPLPPAFVVGLSLRAIQTEVGFKTQKMKPTRQHKTHFEFSEETAPYSTLATTGKAKPVKRSEWRAYLEVS